MPWTRFTEEPSGSRSESIAKIVDPNGAENRSVHVATTWGPARPSAGAVFGQRPAPTSRLPGFSRFQSWNWVSVGSSWTDRSASSNRYAPRKSDPEGGKDAGTGFGPRGGGAGSKAPHARAPFPDWNAVNVVVLDELHVTGRGAPPSN